jgi:hypothetical protein
MWAFLSNDGFSERPIIIMVPFATGGPLRLTRIIDEQISRTLGQSAPSRGGPHRRGLAKPNGHALLIK